MAVPKHILRIHDTEANLLASLKDTQIAYATDIDEAIWRNGTDFHYLSSGKAWNGASYDYSNIDATSITIHDGGGNTKVVDYASLLTETFEINQASDFKTALEANINRKTLIMNERSFFYQTNNTIDVYGINVLIGHDTDISTDVGITADFTENVGSPSTQIICRNTTFSLGLAGGLDFDGNIDVNIFARHFDTTITNLDGLGTITYEKTDSTLPVTGTYTITQSYWDNTSDSASTQGDGITISGGVVSTRTTQGLQYSGAGELKLGPHYLSMASSGVYSGGTLSTTTPTPDTNVTIGICEGFVIDTSTFGIDTIVTTPVSVVSPIVFTPTNIATQNVTYVGLNSSGTQVEWNQPPTPEQRRDNIFLGVAVHSNNSTVEFVNNLQDVSSDITGQVHDLSRYLGYFNIEGNGVTANGANLSFDKAIGKAFKTGVNFTTNPKDPDTNNLPAKVLSSFRYRTQLGAEGLDVTLIDPTSYDNAGTITTIAGSNNQATIQRIYVFASEQIRVQYGQEIYSSFSDAVDAVGKQAFVTESNISENGLLLCSLVVQKGCNDLSDTTCAGFFQAGRFGEIGSIGSTAVGTLQSGYNNSINPEIITDATLGAVSIKNGQGVGTDSLNVLELQNDAGTNTFEVTGEGDVDATNFNGVPLTASGVATNYLDETGAYSVPAGGVGDAVLSATQTFTGVNTFSGATALDGDATYNRNSATFDVMGVEQGVAITNLDTHIVVGHNVTDIIPTGIPIGWTGRVDLTTTGYSVYRKQVVMNLKSTDATYGKIMSRVTSTATTTISWTAWQSISGDVVLSDTQTFTGTNTFSSATTINALLNVDDIQGNNGAIFLKTTGIGIGLNDSLNTLLPSTSGDLIDIGLTGNTNYYFRDLNLKGAILSTGTQVNFANLPTSATGLATGDLWNDAGTMKIA